MKKRLEDLQLDNNLIIDPFIHRIQTRERKENIHNFIKTGAYFAALTGGIVGVYIFRNEVQEILNIAKDVCYSVF